MLSNPGTPFDEDGWADVLSDLRRLYLMVSGGANDLNKASDDVTNAPTELNVKTVDVCVDGVEKKMKVMGSDPY